VRKARPNGRAFCYLHPKLAHEIGARSDRSLCVSYNYENARFARPDSLLFSRTRCLPPRPIPGWAAGPRCAHGKFRNVTTPGSHRRSQEIQTPGWFEYGALLFNFLLEVLLRHRTGFVQPGCTIEVLPVPPAGGVHDGCLQVLNSNQTSEMPGYPCAANEVTLIEIGSRASVHNGRRYFDLGSLWHCSSPRSKRAGARAER